MAIAKCRECGNQVSTEAIACPHCGAPQKQTAPPIPTVISDQNLSQQQIGRTESIVGAEKAISYETKHIKCDVDEVQAVINQHQLFFWEVIGTNTVVSRDSHLESGGIFDSDTIYSVTTTERFSTIDFRRPKELSDLSKIKSVDSQYFSTVNRLENLGSSAINNYATPPPKQFNWIVFLVLCLFYILPGVLFWHFKSKKYSKICAEWQAIKRELDSLVDNNRQILNVN